MRTNLNTPWRADGWLIRGYDRRVLCELSPVVFNEDVDLNELAQFIVKTVNDAQRQEAEDKSSW